MAVDIGLATDYEGLKAVAEYGGWDLSTVYDMAQDLSNEKWQSLLRQAGVNYKVNSNGATYGYTRNVGTTVSSTGTAVETTGNLAVKTAVEDGKVVVKQMEETVTQAGETVSKGGAVTGINTALSVMAVAQTVGAVVKDYKEHTDWWSDLSDKVFMTDGTTVYKPTGNIGIDPIYSAGIGEMLVRRVTDSLGQTHYYKSFMSETDVSAYVLAMAQAGVFSGTETYEKTQEVEEGDVLAPVFGGISSSILSKAVLMSANPTYALSHIGDIWNYITTHYNISDYDYIYCECVASVYDGGSTGTLTVGLAKSESDCRVGSYLSTDVGTYQLASFDSSNNVSVSLSFNKESYNITSGVSKPVIMIGNCRYTGVGICSNLFGTVVKSGGTEEAPIDPSAQVFVVPEGALHLEDIIQALRTQYPNWYNNSFTSTDYDPVTKTNRETVYLPISLPNTDLDASNPPSDYSQPKAQDGTIPDDAIKTQNNLGQGVKPVTTIVSPSTNPTPNDTPLNPSAGVVTGGSNNLWAVYNPSMSEVSGVGAYLWSADIGDLIAKWFANPMDAIISLHLIYATPHTGASQDIVLGYLNSGVQAPIVTNQYTEVDCGSLLVPEYFGDVRDYSPYTQIYIYLPFIGIKSISTEDVIGCKLSVKYNVDVLTGAILCNIYVNKKGATQILYTYAGNCSVQIPLTGADRTRLLSGAISAVSGAVSGGAIGGVVGAIGGGAMGIVNGLHGAGVIDRTGSFSSNAGAMGIKTPYLIINRKEGYDATSFNNFYGLPSNTTVVLSSCKGYTRVKDIHVENIPIATQEEKTSIENMLKQGVVIN